MVATPPKVPDHHKEELNAVRKASKKAVDFVKNHSITKSHKFKHGAGMHDRMKDDVQEDGVRRLSSSLSGLNPEPTGRRKGSGSGDNSADETGFDGVKESEGDKEGKSDGEGKGKKEEAHIGRHGSFGNVLGGSGMHQKMIDRKLKK
jgi:hypothetical protein